MGYLNKGKDFKLRHFGILKQFREILEVSELSDNFYILCFTLCLELFKLSIFHRNSCTNMSF